MGSQQQFCLRWNNHQSSMLNLFDQLLQNEALVDVTLACDERSIKAHKVVLSACSPYFQSLFVENPCQHPIVFLKDVQYSDLRALVDFMYKGEVNVNQEQLSALLETAESLKVRGLTEVTTTEMSSHHHHQQQTTNGEGDNNSCAKIITGNGYNESQQQQLAHHHHHHNQTSMDYHPYLHHHHHHSHSRPVSHSPPPQQPLSPPPSKMMMMEVSEGSNKRSLSPTAKRRKAKPRKRLPENAIPSDHDDSDALDLSTASPELMGGMGDTQDNVYYDSGEFQRANTLLLTTSSAERDHPTNITNIKIEPADDTNNQNNDKDYNSNQKKCLLSPVGSAPTTSSLSTATTLRMPIIPKLQPLSVSVSCSSSSASAPQLPSTSANQSSVIHQDIRRLCQYSRQSQQHKPTWTEEDMVQALEAVQSGRLTYALAARKFDIPKATLHYYVILMKAVEAVRSGRMTAEIAAIKYNVRTSILLDCLFGRQSAGTSSSSTAAAAPALPILIPTLSAATASAAAPSPSTPTISSSGGGGATTSTALPPLPTTLSGAGGGGGGSGASGTPMSSTSGSAANNDKTSAYK